MVPPFGNGAPTIRHPRPRLRCMAELPDPGSRERVGLGDRRDLPSSTVAPRLRLISWKVSQTVPVQVNLYHPGSPHEALGPAV